MKNLSNVRKSNYAKLNLLKNKNYQLFKRDEGVEAPPSSLFGLTCLEIR